MFNNERLLFELLFGVPRTEKNTHNIPSLNYPDIDIGIRIISSSFYTIMKKNSKFLSFCI